MKILFSTHLFYPFTFGRGAERSIYLLAKNLSKKHEMHCVFPSETNRDIRKNGFLVHKRKCSYFSFGSFWLTSIFLNKNWERILEDFIKKNKLDMIFTQLILAPASVNVAKKYKIPSILFVHDLLHLCPRGFYNKDPFSCDNKCWKCFPRNIISYPFFRLALKEQRQAFKKADVVVCNSKYTQRVDKRWYGINPKVIYPFIDLNKIKVENGDKKYITLISPDTVKGVEVFLKITDKLPDRKFWVVGKSSGKIKEELKKRRNIKYSPKVGDMKKVYEKTRILLVPSLLQEAFGMVVVEANANGIPCVVSRRGGLPEALGNGGILINNPLNIYSWIRAIKSLDDEKLYGKLSKNGIKHSKKFDYKRQIIKIEDILAKYMVGDKK